MRSVEFVGKAEKIKSHELSAKSLIEKLSDTLLSLKGRKRSLQSELSSLYAELIAAESDTDEDGEPDYRLIALIENQIDQKNKELSDTESEISQTTGEFREAQQEYAEVEEEKQQTLYEIQERARITSQDASKASDMSDAWASIGASLNQLFQKNFDALAQAASILDGNVSVASTQISSGGKGGSGRTGGGIGIATATGAAAIASSSMIASTKPMSNSLESNQISSVSSFSGRSKYTKGGNANYKGPNFTSSQKSSISSNSYIGARNASAMFGSSQKSHNDGNSAKCGLINKNSVNAKQAISIRNQTGERKHTFADWINLNNYTKQGKYIGDNEAWGYRPYGDDSSKVSSHVISPQLKELSAYMALHGYGKGDYSKYSQDPTWQKLHKAVYPNLHVPLMCESNKVYGWNKMSRYYSGVDDSIENNTNIGAHGDRSANGNMALATEYVKNITGVKSFSKAEELAKSVIAFSSGSDSDIRKSQVNADYESDYFQDAKNCEEFIRRAPKYGNTDPLFRGIHVSEEKAKEFILKIKTGGMIDQLGVASWSTDKEIAKKFARRKAKVGEIKVIFRISGTKMGASIRGISTYSGEDEVLISGEQSVIPVSYEISRRDVFSGEQFLYINAIEL